MSKKGDTENNRQMETETRTRVGKENSDEMGIEVEKKDTVHTTPSGSRATAPKAGLVVEMLMPAKKVHSFIPNTSFSEI